jgi:hypothetical protein
MIQFRQKSLAQDLIPDLIKFLDEREVEYNKITSKEADKVSKVNSRALVLTSFTKNERGYYQMKFKSKEIYGYIKKMLGEIFRMRISNVDVAGREITAETDYPGIAFDIIEVLGLNPHFNLSVVCND